MAEEFIRKAKLKHGDAYDYSLVKYERFNKKVTIICKRHGPFEQTPANHLNFKCKQCKNNKHADAFVTSANMKHNNKYTYDKVVYVNCYTKVIITCPKHGDFEQEPRGHLNGYGCNKCAICVRFPNAITTLEEFKQKARETHGGFYSYDRTTFVGVSLKVLITCPKHGDFEQTAYEHLEGHKCYQCGLDTIREKLSYTQEEFVAKATAVHGGKYTYNKTLYSRNHIKVTVTCPTHGDFEQLPANHLQGHGCSECAGFTKHTTESIVAKFKEIHNGKYDYTKTLFTGVDNFIIVTCPKHGDFDQLAYSHLIGKGCAKCRNSKGERSIMDFLDLLNIKYETQKKFDGCKDVTYLPFDFYLPDFNMLIEFDGKQHSIPIEFWGGQERLEYIQKHDRMKTDFCERNNIKLLRISYNDDILEKLICALF